MRISLSFQLILRINLNFPPLHPVQRPEGSKSQQSFFFIYLSLVLPVKLDLPLKMLQLIINSAHIHESILRM